MVDEGGAATSPITTTIDQPILVEKQSLSPCHVCGRTFLPASLKKHEKICEKNATKKRKVFDSLKQRVEGTDLAAFHQKSYLRRPSIEPAQVEYNRIKRQSQWKEKHLELVNAIRAAKGQNTNQMSTPVRKTAPVMAANERCPSCDRQFGPKAYDRHVEWCKERKARIHHSPANVLLAKERLEARIRYRVPPIKSKRQANKEKYSGGGTSPTEMTASLTSTSKVGSFSRGPSIRRPKMATESGTSTSTSTSSQINRAPEKKEKSPVRIKEKSPVRMVPKSPVLERVQSKTNIHAKRCSLPSLKLNKSDINEVFGIFTVSSISYPNCSSTRSTKSNKNTEAKKLVTWKDTIVKNSGRKVDVKLPQIVPKEHEDKRTPRRKDQTFPKGINTLDKFKNSFQNKEVLNLEKSNENFRNNKNCLMFNECPENTEVCEEDSLLEIDSQSSLNTTKIRLNSPGVNLMYRSAIHLTNSDSSIQSSERISDTGKTDPDTMPKASCESLTQAFAKMHLGVPENLDEIMAVVSKCTADSLEEVPPALINEKYETTLNECQEELFGNMEMTACSLDDLDDKNISEWFENYCLENTPHPEEIIHININASTSTNDLVFSAEEHLKNVVMLFQNNCCQNSSKDTIIINQEDTCSIEEVKITEITSDDDLLVTCSDTRKVEDSIESSQTNSQTEIISKEDRQHFECKIIIEESDFGSKTNFEGEQETNWDLENAKANFNVESEEIMHSNCLSIDATTSADENSVETYSFKLSDLEVSSWSRSNCGECYPHFQQLKRSNSEIYKAYNLQPTCSELVRSNSESNLLDKFFANDKFASRPNMDLTKFTMKHHRKEDSYQSHQQMLRIAVSEFINDCKNRDTSSGRNYLLDEDYTVPKKRMKLATASNDDEQEVDVNKIVVVPGINDSQEEMLTLNATSSSASLKNVDKINRSSSASLLNETYSPRLLILMRKMIDNFQTMAKCNEDDKVLELTKNECTKLIELDTRKLPKMIDQVKRNKNVLPNRICLPKIIDRQQQSVGNQVHGNKEKNEYSTRKNSRGSVYLNYDNVVVEKRNNSTGSQNVPENNAGRGDYDKKKPLKRQNTLFDVAPKKPPSLKSKADVESYFSGDKAAKSNANRNRKSPDLHDTQKEEMETILKPEDLFAVDDEMYEEYKKYEEMYLREKQQKAKSKKQKPKLIEVNYGLLTASEEDDVAQLNKLSNDSAYGSLTRKTPKRNRNAKLSPLEQKNPDSTSSSGSEHNPTANTAKQDLNAHQEQQRLSKFCHECGQKYPLNSAKFCVECGVRRLVL